MTEKRWLDELPLESAERTLLLAGKSAHPPSGTADANWQALCVALSAPAGLATGGSAAYSASVKAASSGIVSKAGAGGLLSAATLKSFAVGVALGVGVSGTSVVVSRVTRPDERPRVAVNPKLKAPEPRATAPHPTTAAAPAEASGAAAPSSSALGETSSLPSEDGPHATSSAPTHLETPTPVPTASSPLGDTSLSEQARELAVVKRLLDAGAATQALRRLEASFGAGTLSTLVEERDALYVQALSQGGRRSEASAAAQRFIDRYPRSPYLAMMRRLVGDE